MTLTGTTTRPETDGARARGDDLPSQWFNVLTCLPEPLPPALDPADDGGSRLELMRSIRLPVLVAQDQAEQPWIDIPGPVVEMLERIGRPTPLHRAAALERYLETPARIYVKREDLLPTGSFKLNSAVAQVHYAKEAGVPGLVTETGAGQWGHAVAYACSLSGLRSVVFWAVVSQRQKPYRNAVLELLEAEVYPSPSTLTELGRRLLAEDPGALGSLGTAIGEAVSFACDHRDELRYVSGSNLPHVLLHQTVIGLETKRQLAALGEEPDLLIACVGGGSNLGGFMGPFLPDKRGRGDGLRLLAAEAATAPRLTMGEWRYDHADPEGITPLTKSYTLGRDYHLPETHVGGLRQHNGSPVVGVLRHHRLLEARAFEERDVFEVGRLFLRTEGILAAPESCHAVKAAIEEAQRAKADRRERVIIVCLSGSGLLDLEGYVANLLGAHG